MNMAATYANQLPSDPQSRLIRIFDLEPAQSAADDTIRGNLGVVSLDENPSYDALSYAWGNPSPPHHIVCGGEKMTVTANCYDALHQLRRSFVTSTIWVDSIRINQADEEEKAHQVSLMRHNFRKAGKVYNWLGKGNEQSDYAIDWLKRVTWNLTPFFAVILKPSPTLGQLFEILRLVLEGSILCKYLLV